MDIARIEQIIKVFEDTTISKMSLEIENIKLKVEKNTVKQIVNQNTISQQPITNTNQTTPKKDMVITSNFVGQFIERGLRKGDKIKKGQVVGYVDVLKTRNEVVSKYSGVIEEVYVNDGDIVEYNTRLYKLA